MGVLLNIKLQLKLNLPNVTIFIFPDISKTKLTIRMNTATMNRKDCTVALVCTALLVLITQVNICTGECEFRSPS